MERSRRNLRRQKEPTGRGEYKRKGAAEEEDRQ